jgi:hypothetical protein
MPKKSSSKSRSNSSFPHLDKLKTRLDKLNKDLEELNALRGMLDEMENGIVRNEIGDLYRKIESVKKDIADVEALLKEGIFENELGGGGKRKGKTAKRRTNRLKRGK